MVAVAGTIGAGKSSLVEWLRQRFDMQPFFEPHDENPYLADFYEDMSRWALHSQLFFLIKRFQIHRRIEREADEGGSAGDRRAIVQDRTIYEDVEIFASHLHRSGHLSDRDWAMVDDLYQTLGTELRPPDLMVYLRCPLRVLSRRIRRRGRDFEQQIPRTYLKALEALYEDWFARYDRSPAIVVDTGTTDYVEDLFDRLELEETVARHLQIPLAETPRSR